MKPVCRCAAPELGRKYDMPGLQMKCSSFIVGQRLTIESLPKWHLIAVTFNYINALKHCHAFLEKQDTNNFYHTYMCDQPRRHPFLAHEVSIPCMHKIQSLLWMCTGTQCKRGSSLHEGATCHFD